MTEALPGEEEVLTGRRKGVPTEASGSHGHLYKLEDLVEGNPGDKGSSLC